MRGIRRGAVVVAALTVVMAGLVAPPAAQAADGIVIWSDPAHAPVLQQLLPNGYKGTPVTVVAKDPATGANNKLIDVSKVPGNDSGGAGAVSTVSCASSQRPASW